MLQERRRDLGKGVEFGGGREMVETAPPEGDQEEADEDEGSAEADPESQWSPMAAKTKPTAEGETEEPVAEKVAEHRGAGVPGAAERASGNGL